jgi:amiloride-sensitive sodium channel
MSIEIHSVKKSIFDSFSLSQHQLTLRNFKWIKLIKFLLLILSLCCLIFCISSAYSQWNVNPLIVTTTKLIPAREIPFPALTICHGFFPLEMQWEYNPIVTMRGFFSDDIPYENISLRQRNYLSVAAHTCEERGIPPKMQKLFDHRSEKDIMKLLWNSSPTAYLGLCRFRRNVIYCKHNFNRVFTTHGICDTFNSQGYHTIFNKDALQRDFDYFTRKNIVKFPAVDQDFLDDENETVEWTLESGYRNESDHVRPIRALPRNELDIFIYCNSSQPQSMKYCSTFGYASNAIVHLPNEMPTPLHRELHAPNGMETFFTLTAVHHKTSSDLRKFSPEQRGCYFDGEKQLMFFHSYTKAHCEYECMANYTLEKCGCVKFSTPRTHDTPICGPYSIDCYQNARVEYSTVENSCNCLPSCNNIRYSVVKDMENYGSYG